MKAVVLAGGVASEPLSAVAGERRKGLIRLGGRPTVCYVLEALQGAGTEAIALVGPVEMRSQVKGCLFVVEGEGVADNLLRGIEALALSKSRQRVLVAACDLPLLQAEDVRGFLERVPEEVGAAACFVREERVKQEQPGAPYTFVRMKDGRYSTGGLYLIRADVAERLAHLVRQLHANRKSQLRVAAMLGIATLIKLRIGILRITDATKRVERLVGEPVWADTEASARTSLDLDGPEDYLYLRDNWTRLRLD